MKTLKTLLTLFALVAAFSTSAFAQETADVTVSAQVEAVIELIPVAINLGTIQQAASVLDANGSDDATESNVGDGASPGSLTIKGSEGVAVVVTWTDAILDTDPAGDQITFTPSVWLGNTEVTNGGTVNATTAGTVLDIGGSLEAPSGTGAYSTTNGSAITFTVQYQ